MFIKCLLSSSDQRHFYHTVFFFSSLTEFFLKSLAVLKCTFDFKKTKSFLGQQKKSEYIATSSILSGYLYKVLNGKH